MVEVIASEQIIQRPFSRKIKYHENSSFSAKNRLSLSRKKCAIANAFSYQHLLPKAKVIGRNSLGDAMTKNVRELMQRHTSRKLFKYFIAEMLIDRLSKADNMPELLVDATNGHFSTKKGTAASRFCISWVTQSGFLCSLERVNAVQEN